jgi:predicted ATPase
MGRIEGIRIENYRVLRDVFFGRFAWDPSQKALEPLTVVIGRNGSGKSTLFDAFGFLSDVLRFGLEEACDLRGRGGIKRLFSKGTSGPLRFTIRYREGPNERPLRYELEIGIDESDRPSVLSERITQNRKNQSKGKPYHFLNLQQGKGQVWSGEEGLEGEDSSKLNIELSDTRRLGIATLGSLKEHPRIARFRNFIESWFLSYFQPNAARSLPLAGPQKHLAPTGENLGNVVQYLEREHKEKFKRILERIAEKIPGISSIDTKPTDDDRLLLRFGESAFADPFYAQQMSDGTLKLFAYLLLLEDPEPPSFIGLEEPENGLYHKLLEAFARELRENSRKPGSPQIFVTTHQPYLVDALTPDETWILEKGEDGFSRLRCAADDELVRNLAQEGLPLGGLWYSDYLDPR